MAHSSNQTVVISFCVLCLLGPVILSMVVLNLPFEEIIKSTVYACPAIHTPAMFFQDWFLLRHPPPFLPSLPCPTLAVLSIQSPTCSRPLPLFTSLPSSLCAFLLVSSLHCQSPIPHTPDSACHTLPHDLMMAGACC